VDVVGPDVDAAVAVEREVRVADAGRAARGLRATDGRRRDERDGESDSGGERAVPGVALAMVTVL
jgi:hypothetical protein